MSTQTETADRDSIESENQPSNVTGGILTILAGGMTVSAIWTLAKSSVAFESSQIITAQPLMPTLVTGVFGLVFLVGFMIALAENSTEYDE